MNTLKRLLTALCAMIPTAVAAADLPVHHAYCEGDLAIWPEALNLDFDYTCKAKDAPRHGVYTLACTYDYPAEGSPFTMQATFRENLKAGTLTYTELGSPDDPHILERCD